MKPSGPRIPIRIPTRSASISGRQYKLYKLIWQRFVASQMNAGRLRPDDRRHRREGWTGAYDFRVTGSVLKFDGFLKVYEESRRRRTKTTSPSNTSFPR